MALYECDETEVKNLLLSLHPRKASGPNSIPTDVLHLLAEDICKPLSYIFNLSFNSGIYPSMLKVAKCYPSFQEGLKTYSVKLQTYFFTLKYKQNFGKTHVQESVRIPGK